MTKTVLGYHSPSWIVQLCLLEKQNDQFHDIDKDKEDFVSKKKQTNIDSCWDTADEGHS